MPAVDSATRAEPAIRPHRWWRDALRRRLLAATDLLAGAIASAALVSVGPDLGWALAFLPSWVLLAKLLGLYERDHQAIRHLTIDELPSLAGWAAAGTACITLLMSLTPAAPIGAGSVIMASGVGLLAVLVLRGGGRAAWRRLTPPERTAVIGDGALAESIRRKLELFGDMHMDARVVPGLENGTSAADVIPRLPQLSPRVDRLILAWDQLDAGAVAPLVSACREHQIKLNIVSPLRGRSAPAPRFSRVADLRVFEYDTSDVSRSTVALKRALDVVISLSALAITAPLLALIALAIRLDSRGPAIFVQRRAGRGGRPFRIYKFRTMSADAERRLAEVVSIDDLPEPAFKLNGDPRVTRVGRRLRRFSLDELPQLWNVLRGDMSLVGPRPEQIELVRRYRPEHLFRLNVKPGITGPMQVFGRGELSFAERLAVEVDYVENLSVTRDLRILAQTIPAIARGTGAF
jgi:exopolysaccharide biosynthesis polyprenyl glycosylphosphotransferase